MAKAAAITATMHLRLSRLGADLGGIFLFLILLTINLQ